MYSVIIIKVMRKCFRKSDNLFFIYKLEIAIPCFHLGFSYGTCFWKNFFQNLSYFYMLYRLKKRCITVTEGEKKVIFGNLHEILTVLKTFKVFIL